MKSVSNMPCEFRWPTVWLCASMALLCLSCSDSPSPALESGAPVRDSTTAVQSSRPVATPLPTSKPALSGINMTYHNDASTLQMTIDPYEENLSIEMKRTPKPPVVPEKPVAPEPPKKDTVYVMQQAQPPQNQAPAVPAPPPPATKTDTVHTPPPPVDTAAILEKSAALTDEVMRRIHQAQEYFYKKDYNSALRLVKSAQEMRPTAEGSALRGSIHYMLNDKDAARFYWNEALLMNPNLPEVVDALDRLNSVQEVR